MLTNIIVVFAWLVSAFSFKVHGWLLHVRLLFDGGAQMSPGLLEGEAGKVGYEPKLSATAKDLG